MNAQDLVFHTIEGDPPPLVYCNYCSAQPVTLAAKIPLSGDDGAVALIAVCSRACASVIKRHPDAGRRITEVVAGIESLLRREREQWPAELK